MIFLISPSGAVFVVTFIMMGFNVWAAAIVMLIVCMIIVHMLGCMALAEINANAVSLVNLVMVSIGYNNNNTLQILNQGNFGTSHFVLYREVILSLETPKCISTIVYGTFVFSCCDLRIPLYFSERPLPGCFLKSIFPFYADCWYCC